MSTPLVAGNWKMNGSRADAEGLVTAIRDGAAALGGVELVVCPSFVLIPGVAAALDGSSVLVGAQNVCDQDQGAYTGEVSGAMLAEFGCRYAIVGHSERRQLYAESDEQVALRYAAAKRHGLVPILCVGETLEERDAARTEAVVARQMEAVFALLGAQALRRAVVAYEPVWAIGTGKTATPEQAQAVHRYIRTLVGDRDENAATELRILYGGSMKPDNAPGLMAMPDIDGGLIGGASLKAEDFLAICRAAAQGG